MSKTYPSGENVQFILCEDVRSEAGGKVSLMGVFPGKIIVFHAPEDSMVTPVVFYFVINDGEGDFKVKFELENPSNEIDALYETEITKKIDNPAVIIIKAPLLKFKSTGRYIARLLIDEESHERDVLIRREEPKEGKEKD